MERDPAGTARLLAQLAPCLPGEDGCPVPMQPGDLSGGSVQPPAEASTYPKQWLRPEERGEDRKPVVTIVND
jgi:hypothetical protein